MINELPPAYLLNSDLDKIIVSESEIKGIITRISDEINKDYKGKKLVVCGILKGAFVFMSDLVRKITAPSDLVITFIKASSYGENSVSSGNVKTDINEFSGLNKYKDYDILVVDDILDSGRTLHYLNGYFREKGFVNVDFCVLLDKPERHEIPIYAKYIGKQIENEFVVGYGLDYNERYRHLPFISKVKI